MKTQLKTMVLLAGGALISLTGCQKSDGFVSPSAQPVAKKADASIELSSSTRSPVTITGIYDFSTYPNVSGTFTTGGALTISGVSQMNVGLNFNGVRAHCVVTLFPSTGGTIIIDQQCQFASSPPKGRWEIVSGTGAYANLNGNGSLTMPANQEAMTGVIY